MTRESWFPWAEFFGEAGQLGYPKGARPSLPKFVRRIPASERVSLDVVSVLLGHTLIKTTGKHYAQSVNTRHGVLEAVVVR